MINAGADTGFSEGGGGGGGDGHKGGGGDRGWSPLSAKNYYLNTHNFQLQGGGGVITPTTPAPLYPPLLMYDFTQLVYCHTQYPGIASVQSAFCIIQGRQNFVIKFTNKRLKHTHTPTHTRPRVCVHVLTHTYTHTHREEKNMWRNTHQPRLKKKYRP